MNFVIRNCSVTSHVFICHEQTFAFVSLNLGFSLIKIRIIFYHFFYNPNLMFCEPEEDS